jgi:hypothetical protein
MLAIGGRQRAELCRGGAWRDSLRDFGVWMAVARAGRLPGPTIRCFEPTRAPDPGTAGSLANRVLGGIAPG